MRPIDGAVVGSVFGEMIFILLGPIIGLIGNSNCIHDGNKAREKCEDFLFNKVNPWFLIVFAAIGFIIGLYSAFEKRERQGEERPLLPSSREDADSRQSDVVIVAALGGASSSYVDQTPNHSLEAHEHDNEVVVSVPDDDNKHRYLALSENGAAASSDGNSATLDNKQAYQTNSWNKV